MIYDYDDRRLDAAGSFFVAPSADVIGSVRLGEGASVWFNAVLRGDNDWIEVGDGSNVQDGTICHTDPGEPVIIGREVTIGHGVLLHGCVIGDGALIGNRAIVLDGARIGARCLIAAGALITPGTQIPEGSVVMGAPGRIIRPVGEKDLARMAIGAESYRRKAADYARLLKVVDRS
jgi:carbonic anhydrase/acetyltransferase-like protein (isoleucine patch superfamily)